MAKEEITSMIDATNRLVEIGDTVAFMEARGQSGQEILVAKVIGFTPKKIRLAYKRHHWWKDEQAESITKYPHQCTRIDYKPADLVLALKYSGE
jgi:hypothetical protein